MTTYSQWAFLTTAIQQIFLWTTTHPLGQELAIVIIHLPSELSEHDTGDWTCAPHPETPCCSHSSAWRPLPFLYCIQPVGQKLASSDLFLSPKPKILQTLVCHCKNIDCFIYLLWGRWIMAFIFFRQYTVLNLSKLTRETSWQFSWYNQITQHSKENNLNCKWIISSYLL